tara:strand:- start:29 stop:253 length:225 start_codon:yes stop_codon:yes gene_type:complete
MPPERFTMSKYYPKLANRWTMSGIHHYSLTFHNDGNKKYYALYKQGGSMQKEFPEYFDKYDIVDYLIKSGYLES